MEAIAEVESQGRGREWCADGGIGVHGGCVGAAAVVCACMLT